MVTVKRYHLPATERIPNSPFPLLHYSGAVTGASDTVATKAYDLFSANGWTVNWVFRYGSTQASHYHSRAHECMCVLTGEATIRFGVADTSPDLEKSTYGSGREEGGVELYAKAGDVFIIPAGVAHKTYNTEPKDEFALLTPGSGKGIEADDPRGALKRIQLKGFTMLGAYPAGSDWDFALGGQDHEDWDNVWAVPKPENDPILGRSSEGLQGLWKSAD